MSTESTSSAGSNRENDSHDRRHSAVTPPERPSLPEVEVAAAASVQCLGAALLGHQVDPRLSAEVARTVAMLADRVRAGDSRSKADAFRRYSGHQRIEHFLETGSWPDPPAEGEAVTFDALSFVGGRLSPISAGATFHRDGEVAVARVTFGPSYEGPPTRVHGGMLASVFDEVMGVVFRVLGLPSAFTASLTVRYECPAPLGEPLEFRAHLTTVEGRKHTVEAVATGPDGRFASATGLFIEMTLKPRSA